MPPRPGGVETAAIVSVAASGYGIGRGHRVALSVVSRASSQHQLWLTPRTNRNLLQISRCRNCPKWRRSLAASINASPGDHRVVQESGFPAVILNPFKTPRSSPGQRSELLARSYHSRRSPLKHIVCELSSSGAAPDANRPDAIRAQRAHACRTMDRPSRHDRSFARHHPRISGCSSLMRGSRWPAAGRLRFVDTRVGSGRNSSFVISVVATAFEVRRATNRSPSAPTNLPPSSATGGCTSRRLCSTSRFSPAWAISTPTKAYFIPASGRAGEPTASPAPSSTACGSHCARSSPTPFALAAPRCSDYVEDADGARGFFQLEHCVYLRTGRPCRRCKTPIQRIIVAGRGTHYCPKCQR